MKKDVLQEYVSLQTALLREREELVARLRQIENVLGQDSNQEARSGARAGRRGRGVNSMSLKDAVLQVTSIRPLTKQEVYEAVQKLGYKFGGKDPLNSLGVVLYGRNPRFRNEDGRFSPLGGALDLSSVATSDRRGGRNRGDSAPRGAKRKGQGRKNNMSPEGRARIAAAARERWAKARAAKQS